MDQELTAVPNLFDASAFIDEANRDTQNANR